MVQRAKTTLGLLAQVIALRWNALGKRGKILLVAFGVLAGVTAAQFGMCMLGTCGPCGASSASPCSAAADSSEPCPYAAEELEAATPEVSAEADVSDTPPCHAR